LPTRIPFAAGPACRSPLLFGALLIVTGELMFASMGASIRFAAQSLPNEMVVFLRNLLGGALAALAKVTVRRLSRSEPAPRTVFYFALTGALASAVPLIWAWQTPSAEALLWMFAVALFATLGQLLMTRGFAFAPAGQLSAFTYSSVVFASLYGWALWQEVVGWSTISGALLIALSGVSAARARGDRAAAIA
jgi:drug/metabolite transporter (DMT)-like permease